MLGRGVGRDYVQADHWLRHTAEKGDAAAKDNLQILRERLVGK